jgi:hypothetical protein
VTVGIDFQKVLPEPILGGFDGKLSNVKISQERRSVTDHETYGSIIRPALFAGYKTLLLFWQSQKEGKNKESKTPKFLVVSRAANILVSGRGCTRPFSHSGIWPPTAKGGQTNDTS